MTNESIMSKLNDWMTVCRTCGGRETGPCPKLNERASREEKKCTVCGEPITEGMRAMPATAMSFDGCKSWRCYPWCKPQEKPCCMKCIHPIDAYGTEYGCSDDLCECHKNNMDNIKKRKEAGCKYLCCIWCGKDIPIELTEAQYCSQKCKHEAMGHDKHQPTPSKEECEHPLAVFRDGVCVDCGKAKHATNGDVDWKDIDSVAYGIMHADSEYDAGQMLRKYVGDAVDAFADSMKSTPSKALDEAKSLGVWDRHIVEKLNSLVRYVKELERKIKP